MNSIIAKYTGSLFNINNNGQRFLDLLDPNQTNFHFMLINLGALYSLNKLEEKIIEESNNLSGQRNTSSMSLCFHNNKNKLNIQNILNEAESHANFDLIYYLASHPNFKIADLNNSNPIEFTNKRIETYTNGQKLVKGLNIEAFCNNCNEYRIVNIGSEHGYDDFGNKMNCFILGELVWNMFCPHCKIQIIHPRMRHLLFYKCKSHLSICTQNNSQIEKVTNQAFFLKSYTLNGSYRSFTIKILDCF